MINFFVLNWATILNAIAQIATIILVGGLWVAYRQYRQSVELAKTTVKREAVRLAAEQSERFGRTLVKEALEIRSKMAVAKCEFLKQAKVTFTETEIKYDGSKVTDAERAKMKPFDLDILCYMNALEGFSIFFASNVADDNVGYVECGRSFVQGFETDFPFYMTYDLNHYYRATQTLYWRWKKRTRQEDLMREHQELQARMTMTLKKIDADQMKPQEPLGTPKD